MSMPPSGVSGVMDEEALIEAEIQQQLQQLDLEDDDGDDQWNDLPFIPDQEADGACNSPKDESEVDFPPEMGNYIRMLNQQTAAFEAELAECDELLNYKHGQNSTSVVPVEDLELLKEAADAEGQDPEEFRRKILEEISRDTENLTGDDLEEEEIVLVGVGHGPEDEASGVDDDRALVLVDQRQLDFRRKMKEQIDNVEKQYRIREERLKVTLDEQRKESDRINKEVEEQRLQKRHLLEKEVTMIAKERMVQQEKFEEEERHTEKQQEEELHKYQKNLNRMAEEIDTEQRMLGETRRQEEEKQERTREQAAVRIQSVYRGHRARKEHATINAALEEKAELRKRAKEEEQIREAEQRIQQRREEMEGEERSKKEEREREDEEKKLKEEEKRNREEQVRLENERKIEEKRKKIEDEEKRKLEEKLKKEEEKRIEAEEITKKEEAKMLKEQKRKDEERKKEEIRKRREALRKEEERKVEEEKKKEEERLEAERKKKEEEILEAERKKKEEQRLEAERKKKEAERQDEERKKKEAEEQRQKEEQKRIEGGRKQKQENLNQNGEIRTPRSERSERRGQTSRSSLRDEDKQSRPASDQKAMMLGLPDRTEIHRLEWIKNCIPWSKVSNEPWKLKTNVVKKPGRRPASAKKLEPLDEYIITSAAQVDTLRQVTTVQLKDLPGCNLSTLGQCWGLKYLSMTNCNLVAVDGLQSCKQLQLVDFKHNFIEYVDLKDLVNLTYVDLSENRLGVIHGLEGCGNLRWLNLSHNRITRTGGLYSLRRLHTLDLSNNQIISTAGLGDTPTLQVIDLSHNHLQDCQDITKLCLLQVLKLSSNNLLHFPDLKNQVLLQTLCVEDNSLQCIKRMGLCWLPLLQRLDLSQNSIEHLVNFEVFHLLRDLDVGSNQILDPGVLTKCLSGCVYLEKLGVIDNPAVEEEPDLRSKLADLFPRLSSLDGAEFIGSQSQNSAVRARNSFEAMCLSQIQTFEDINQNLEQDRRSVTSKSKTDLSCVCDIHFRFCDKMYKMAVEFRNSHEYGEITIAMPTAPSTPKTGSRPRSARTKLVPVIKEEEYVSPKELFERALQNGNTPVSSRRSHDTSGGVSAREAKVTANMVGKILERDKDSEAYRMQRERSAILIQAAWRGFCVRRRLLQDVRQIEAMSDIDYQVLQELHQAATKIQSVFRGYNLRNKLEKAIEFARLEEDDDDEFNEVDLGEFNFDEDMLDDWRPPETPQFPASHAVLGKPPSGKLSSADQIPNLELGDKPHPPTQPRKAWRGFDSPLSEIQTPQGRRPPSSLASGTISVLDSHRSAMSKKEEKLTEEWGFKDSQTAFLMMQRAKKMKYNAERRKKLSKLDPKQRLALFRKLEETTHVRTVVQPSRKTLPRKEYFQARQQEMEKKELDQKVEQNNRTKRTFEWIHTQVGDYMVTDSRINKHPSEVQKKMYGSEGNLPKMTSEATSGRPIRLVGSPGMDIMSIDSASNYGDQSHNSRRFSAGSDANSTRLPPIKTGSAPSVRGKEKMSWRRKEVNKSIGWGGGKKRSHLS